MTGSPSIGGTGSSSTTPLPLSSRQWGSAPQLLNRRDWGGKMPPKSKSVDRNTPYGNPFRIGVHGRTRDEVMDRFDEWAPRQTRLIERAKRELRGYNLACWCFPKRCHGAFWLRVANEPD